VDVDEDIDVADDAVDSVVVEVDVVDDPVAGHSTSARMEHLASDVPLQQLLK